MKVTYYTRFFLGINKETNKKINLENQQFLFQKKRGPNTRQRKGKKKKYYEKKIFRINLLVHFF